MYRTIKMLLLILIVAFGLLNPHIGAVAGELTATAQMPSSSDDEAIEDENKPFIDGPLFKKESLFEKKEPLFKKKGAMGSAKETSDPKDPATGVPKKSISASAKKISTSPGKTSQDPLGSADTSQSRRPKVTVLLPSTVTSPPESES